MSATPLTVKIVRSGGHVCAACECAWRGDLHSTRTIGAIALACADAQQHVTAHTTGAGFFNNRHGWTPCDPHPAVMA